MVRRDRIKLPAWALGIALFTLYYTMAVRAAYSTEADLRGVTQMIEGPMGALLTGPGYGLDAVNYERFFVSGYGLYVIMLAGLMSILLVSRHTRVEEQTGRSELVRANVVGRHAQLTAALVVAVIANAAAVLTATVIMVGVAGFAFDSSFLFACGVGALGLVFAGVTALTVQVTEYSRAAAGLAGVAMGAAFAVRAAGDVLDERGSILSWFSPLAWPQQSAPFVLDRWWPLSLCLGFAALTAAAGYALSARRDLGAGLFAVRPGPATAAAWMRSPITVAVRLQRAAVVWWTLTFVVAGGLFGAFTTSMADAFDELPETLLTALGGQQDVVDGYLGMLAIMYALTVGIYAILAVQGLRGEETRGRLEPVLATATSRWVWLGGHLAVVALGVLVILLAAGVGTAVGASVATGEWTTVGELVLAHVAHTPAVLLILAIAGLLYGFLPRLIGVTWVALAWGLLTGVFGPVLKLPGWTYDLSPFEHIARMPLEGFAVLPALVLTGLAVAVAAVGMAGFRRRDIHSN